MGQVLGRRCPRRTGECEATAEMTLLALPREVLAELLRHLTTLDLSRVDQLCHAFHSAAPESAVEQALRLRAAAAGRAAGWPVSMAGLARRAAARMARAAAFDGL